MRKILSILVLCSTIITAGEWVYIDKYYKCYWSETKIIYIRADRGMTPYISEKGKYCRYVDDRIEEVE